MGSLSSSSSFGGGGNIDKRGYMRCCAVSSGQVVERSTDLWFRLQTTNLSHIEGVFRFPIIVTGFNAKQGLNRHRDAYRGRSVTKSGPLRRGGSDVMACVGFPGTRDFLRGCE